MADKIAESYDFWRILFSMIQRELKKHIIKKIGKGKAIIIMGARQVGKTTMIKDLLKNEKYLYLNGDDPVTREMLADANTEVLKQIIGPYQVLFIDEAQRITNIGLTLKLIIDQFTDVQLLVSGSSSFDLAHSVNEPLTGRKWEYQLYPVSWKEFEDAMGYLTAEKQIETRILYGMYPDVINNLGVEKEVLHQLVDSYLYKDIYSFGGIRKPEVLQKLTRALALQIGSEVSFNELANTLQVSKDTIGSYIELLEKAFVVFRLSSYSMNLRNEIKNNRKIYFYDTGVRNAVIGNFSPLETRTDKGILWENFMISERLKFIENKRRFIQPYFWRTKYQQEIDYVEEEEGQITAYEIKWNEKKSGKFPDTFTNTYNAETKVINRKNFRSFIKK